MKGNTAIGCANYKECGFKIPFEMLGKKLTESQLIDLLLKGKTAKIKGLIRPGNTAPFDAVLKLSSDFNVEF
jgi:DNA topoisomerase-3